MDFKIPAGIRYDLEITVKPEDSAKSFGSGLVDVFATPAMIALMEKTALQSLTKYIPGGYTTVGAEINIKHLKPTAIGKKVRAESYLRSFDGRRLYFELHAWDEKGMIGIGTHTRVVVKKEEFKEKLK